MKRVGTTQLATVLIDTGAEDNILSLESLEHVFQVSKEAIRPLGFNLSLRGSTGLRNNAILGKVTVELFFLLEASKQKSEFDQHHWISSKIDFLVADNSVSLKNIIIGIPFMRKLLMSLHSLPRPKLSELRYYLRIGHIL